MKDITTIKNQLKYLEGYIEGLNSRVEELEKALDCANQEITIIKAERYLSHLPDEHLMWNMDSAKLIQAYFGNESCLKPAINYAIEFMNKECQE